MKRLAIAVAAMWVGLSGVVFGKEAKLSWYEFTKWAYDTSVRQGNGKATEFSYCDRKEAQCVSAVYYSLNDKMNAAVTTKDFADRIKRRLICTFNDELTIRTCTDFDNKVVTLEIKNSNGKWEMVDSMVPKKFSASRDGEDLGPTY